MNDLVQRLRAKYTVTDEFSTIRRPVNPDGHEAADRIEALTAKAEALVEALRGIDRFGHRHPGYGWSCGELAADALKAWEKNDAA